MLVDVKTETITNTPWDATLVPCSVLCDLNRVQRLSDSQKKTCFNSSKGGRIRSLTPIVIDTHDWFRRSRKEFLLSFVKMPFLFSPKGISIPTRPEGRGILEIF
jgi:hypothetical protein